MMSEKAVQEERKLLKLPKTNIMVRYDSELKSNLKTMHTFSAPQTTYKCESKIPLPPTGKRIKLCKKILSKSPPVNSTECKVTSWLSNCTSPRNYNMAPPPLTNSEAYYRLNELRGLFIHEKRRTIIERCDVKKEDKKIVAKEVNVLPEEIKKPRQSLDSNSSLDSKRSKKKSVQVEAPLSPESQKKSELCTYLKLMDLNRTERKNGNIFQNRRSTRVKNLLLLTEKKELEKKLITEAKKGEENENDEIVSRKSFGELNIKEEVQEKKLQFNFHPKFIPKEVLNRMVDFEESMEPYIPKHRKLKELSKSDKENHMQSPKRLHRNIIHQKINVKRKKDVKTRRSNGKSELIRLKKNTSIKHFSRRVLRSTNSKRLRSRINLDNLSVLYNKAKTKIKKKNEKKREERRNMLAKKRKNSTSKTEIEEVKITKKATKETPATKENVMTENFLNKVHRLINGKIDMNKPSPRIIVHSDHNYTLNSHYVEISRKQSPPEVELVPTVIAPKKVETNLSKKLKSEMKPETELVRQLRNKRKSSCKLTSDPSSSKSEIEQTKKSPNKIALNEQVPMKTQSVSNPDESKVGFHINPDFENIAEIIGITIKKSKSHITTNTLSSENTTPSVTQNSDCAAPLQLNEVDSICSDTSNQNKEELSNLSIDNNSSTIQSEEPHSSQVDEDICVTSSNVIPDVLPVRKDVVKPLHRNLIQSRRKPVRNNFQEDDSLNLPWNSEMPTKSPNKSYSIQISRQNGAVLNSYYYEYNLVITQDSTVSFWIQSPLGSMLEAQNMWISKGSIQRLILEKGSVRKESKDSMLATENSCAYIELWTKEHKSDRRERPVADIFAVIYYWRTRQNGPEKKVLQLQNINGFSDDVRYVVLKNTNSILVSWRTVKDDSTISILHCYQLANDFQTIIKIKEMESVEHVLSSLHIIEDCDTLVMGCGEQKVTIWNLEFGYIVATIDIYDDLPEADNLWVKSDRGFVFTLQQFPDGVLRLLAINGINQSWKRLQTFKTPVGFKKMMGVCVQNGTLICFYSNGMLCWNIETGVLLVGDLYVDDMGNDTISIPSGNHVVIISSDLQVHVRNALSYLIRNYEFN